jgi:hypothetical protein
MNKRLITERDTMATKKRLLLKAVLVVFFLYISSTSVIGSIEKQNAAAKDTAQAASDTTMKLRGDEDGTIFKSLRIEGEDRVRVRFERPELALNLDPAGAPGLEWESIHAVLDRRGLDFITSYLSSSVGVRSAYHARPWLDGFSQDAVARFRPALEGVAQWRLLVANSQGDTVAVFEGTKNPPKEIAWDGISIDGAPTPPGLTYSYVMEAYDKAGNKRSFVGSGFELPPYRLETKEKHVLLFPGNAITNHAPAKYGAAVPPSAILLEVASLLNQEASIDVPIQIDVTARSFGDADRLAREVTKTLEPLLLGDPKRLLSRTKVEPDAPEMGTVAISVPR